MYNNLFSGIFFAATACVSLCVFVFTLIKVRENKASRWLMAMCLMSALWSVDHSLFYLVSDAETALILSDLRYFCSSMLAVCTYAFCMIMFKYEKLNIKYLLLLAIVPALNLIFCIVFRNASLFRISTQMAGTEALRELTHSYGSWYYIQTVFSLSVLALSGVIALRHYIKLPRNFRSPAAIVMNGILLCFALSFLRVIQINTGAMDVTPIAANIMMAFIYFAVFHSRASDILFYSRDAVFENISYPVIVLSGAREVLGLNRMARDLFVSLDLPMEDINYSRFYCAWKKAHSAREFKEDRSIVTITEEGADVHYQISETALNSNRGWQMGYYVEIKNITPIIHLMHKLEEEAYFDQLTGLRNRRAYNEATLEVDIPENYPLCAVFGDADGLKRINDEYGHAEGDLLLQSIAAALVACFPAKNLIFRIGGDEFVCLAPKTSAEVAERMIKRAEKLLEAGKPAHFKSGGISLGYAIKRSRVENMSELIRKADEHMYSTKRDRRKRRSDGEAGARS